MVAAAAEKYDGARQGGSAAVQPKAYNADADVTVDAGKAEKKKKKVGMGWDAKRSCSGGAGCAWGLVVVWLVGCMGCACCVGVVWLVV